MGWFITAKVVTQWKSKYFAYTYLRNVSAKEEFESKKCGRMRNKQDIIYYTLKLI